jgi:hypothetical protein
MSVSRHCAQGTHGHCMEFGTCDCLICHLGPCDECGATNLQTLFDHPQIPDRSICASCYRYIVARMPKPVTRCDECGAPGAFRNPGHRRNEFKCIDCHRKAGESLQLTSSVASFGMPCKTFDIDDPRHTWVHIRGNRFQCKCGAKRYDNEMRNKVRGEYLDK